MSATTRGRWTFSRRGLRIYGGATGNVHIASVVVNADYRANGSLLAAAPDLMAALKECALQIAQNHGRKLTYDEQNALAWARDVIAKAEGGA